MTLNNIRNLLILNNREILNRIENIKFTIATVVGTNMAAVNDDISTLNGLLEQARKDIDNVTENTIVLINEKLQDIDSVIDALQGHDIKALQDIDKALAEDIAENVQAIKDINAAAVTLTQSVQDHINNTVVHVTQDDKDLWNAILESAKGYANELFNGVTSFNVEIVSSLPSKNIKTLTVYLLPNNNGSSIDYYDEYMYINNKWEVIGSTYIDLSHYITDTVFNAYKQEVTNKFSKYSTTAQIESLLGSYAKKVDLHSHKNADVLNKISQSPEGILLFDGQEIKGGSSDLVVSEEEDNAIQQREDGIFVEDKTKDIDDLKNKILDVGQYIAQVENFEDTPVGHILSFMGTIPPPHYLMCDGAEYPITQYQKLADFFIEQYGKVNEFGGDGIETFCVPSLNESITLFSSANSDIIGYVKCIKFEPTYYIAYSASLAELNAIKETNQLLREQNDALKAEIQALSDIIDEMLEGLPNEST